MGGVIGLKMKRYRKQCLLSVLVLLLTAVVWSGTDPISPGQSWAADLLFDQNQGGQGGYQSGQYDSTAIQPTADNWTRQSRFSPGDQARLKWQYSVAAPIVANPVVGNDGTIYFGARNGAFYAISADGHEKWSLVTADQIVSAAVIGMDDTIYIGSRDGRLYALTPEGRQKWVYNTGNMIEVSPVIGRDGTIYLTTADGRLIALSNTATVKWTFYTGGSDYAAALGQDGCIYAGSREGILYCIKADGEQKWKLNLENSLASPAIDEHNNIYVSTGDALYMVNSKGQTVYSYKLDGNNNNKTPIALAADGSVYTGGNVLHRFAPDAMNWTAGVYSCSTPVLGANGNIYVASNNISGILYAVKPDGSTIWSIPVGGVEGSPVIAKDGTIYVTSKDGRLSAIDTVPLAISDSRPKDGDSNIPLDKNLQITFNRNLNAGDGFERIKLYDSLTNDVPITRTINGNVLTLEPVENLKYKQTYTLKIPAEALKDDTRSNLVQEYRLIFSTPDSYRAAFQAVFTMGQSNYLSLGCTEHMDAAPFVEAERSYVPLRYLALALGITENDIKWDQQQQIVSLEKDQTQVEVSPNRKSIKVNGISREMDIAPVNRNGRIYLPARPVAEAFGYEVGWDPGEKAVYIAPASSKAGH